MSPLHQSILWPTWGQKAPLVLCPVAISCSILRFFRATVIHYLCHLTVSQMKMESLLPVILPLALGMNGCISYVCPRSPYKGGLWGTERWSNLVKVTSPFVVELGCLPRFMLPWSLPPGHFSERIISISYYSCNLVKNLDVSSSRGSVCLLWASIFHGLDI